MTAVVIIASVVVVGCVVVVVARSRRRPQNRLEGVEGFRRHMDALSSEARRDVIDRVREARREPEDQ